MFLIIASPGLKILLSGVKPSPKLQFNQKPARNLCSGLVLWFALRFDFMDGLVYSQGFTEVAGEIRIIIPAKAAMVGKDLEWNYTE